MLVAGVGTPGLGAGIYLDDVAVVVLTINAVASLAKVLIPFNVVSKEWRLNSYNAASWLGSRCFAVSSRLAAIL